MGLPIRQRLIPMVWVANTWLRKDLGTIGLHSRMTVILTILMGMSLRSSMVLVTGLKILRAALAMVCASYPKYPALHYLFPVSNHDQNDIQPAGEEYISTATSGYIFNDQGDAAPANDTGVNAGVTYQVVGDDGANPGVEEADDTGLSIIAFAPKTSGFLLPRTDTGTASGGRLKPGNDANH